MNVVEEFRSDNLYRYHPKDYIDGMRSLLAFVVLTSSLVSGVVHAQSTDAEIGQRLIGKPLLLRGFWAGDKLKFHSDGTPVKAYGVRPFTESGITVKSIRWKVDVLQIDGGRNGLAFDATSKLKLLPFATEDVTIQIERGSEGRLQQALRAIFADDVTDVATGLPDYWQPYARQHFLHESLPAGKKDFLDETAVPGDTVKQIGGSVKPPQLLHSEDPGYPATAKQIKYSGTCMIYLWLSPSGKPEHIRIARPAGVGLDESAVEAVQKYRFAPATQNGTPVKVDMFIGVNFQVF